jgi:predicted dehydrogenase
MAQYGIGHDHAAGKARVMRDSEAVELVGVYEPAAWLRGSLGARPPYDGVHWFGSAREMLEDASITAVAVEGRVSENLAFARACLEHGKHVWLDKPAGDDLNEFRALLRLAAARNLHVQLGYMFRYNAGYQFMLDWAASGRLGAIRSVRTRISSGVATDISWRRWDSRGEQAGGLMFILAGHAIDIVVALLGRPHGVSAFARQHTDAFPWYRDNNVAVFEYPDALAVVESVSGEVEPGSARRMEVYGTRGSVILEPMEPPRLRLCLDADRDGYQAGWQEVPVEARPRYVESLRAFLATIHGEQPADRTFAHELAVQETLLAAAGLQSLVPAR